MYRNFVFISGAVLACFILVSVQGQDARCFQFTWLGPRFTNNSVFMNSTCADATRLSSGVPCFQPLVVSYDGSWPDVDYIWRNHANDATCILANNDVCAQYTYYFNGVVENSTYMCTRAVDHLDSAINSGCYSQRNGSWTTRVCFCNSIPGGVPCNDATSAIPSALFFITMSLLVVSLFSNKGK